MSLCNLSIFLMQLQVISQMCHISSLIDCYLYSCMSVATYCPKYTRHTPNRHKTQRVRTYRYYTECGHRVILDQVWSILPASELLPLDWSHSRRDQWRGSNSNGHCHYELNAFAFQAALSEVKPLLPFLHYSSFLYSGRVVLWASNLSGLWYCGQKNWWLKNPNAGL